MNLMLIKMKKESQDMKIIEKEVKNLLIKFSDDATLEVHLKMLVERAETIIELLKILKYYSVDGGRNSWKVLRFQSFSNR